MDLIRIDGVEYDKDTLSEDARAQLASVQFCHDEIVRLEAEMAVVKAAGNAYGAALNEEIKKMKISPRWK